LNLYEVYFPVVTTKFNRNIHSIEKWFSKGLLISRANKNKLSKACLTCPTQENINKFKLYRNTYNATVRAAKKLYFDKQLKLAQSNLKKNLEYPKGSPQSNSKKI
jgi:hypothetical protein